MDSFMVFATKISYVTCCSRSLFLLQLVSSSRRISAFKTVRCSHIVLILQYSKSEISFRILVNIGGAMQTSINYLHSYPITYQIKKERRRKKTLKTVSFICSLVLVYLFVYTRAYMLQCVLYSVNTVISCVLCLCAHVKILNLDKLRR